jgi:DNA-binding protein HU-beta
MNKNDLVEQHELTKSFARELVESVFQTIMEAAQKGEEVSLFGFGTFKVAERAARKGRNPHTREAVTIAASKTVKFKAATALKVGLNKRRRTTKAH